MSITRARVAQSERVAAVLAAAMHQDPLSIHFFPDPRHRRRALEAMYDLVARVAVRSGATWVSSPAVEGVALWEMPGRSALRARHLSLRRVARFLRVAGIARAAALGRYESWAAGCFHRHVPRGSAHLLLLAVDPAHQGRGHGSRLVRSALATLDAEAVPAALETQNPANVGLYEHLGFRVVYRGVVPGCDVGHWIMVRAVGTAPV